MVYGTIYSITNRVSGKVYVGQTTRSVHKRFNEHFRTSKRQNYPLYKAMRKYKKKDFFLDILCECLSQEELDEKEIYYSEHLNSLVPFGYNCRVGQGKGKECNELKKRKSEFLLNGGNPLFNSPYFSDDHRRNISESLKGHIVSEETKNILSKKAKERYISKENHPSFGRTHSLETKEKIANKKAKSYTFISPEGEIVSIFNLKQFCENYNLNYSLMNKVWNEKREHHKGWTKNKGMEECND